MQENQIQVLGFDHLKDLYEADIDFQEYYKACKNTLEVAESHGWSIHFNMVYSLRTVNCVYQSVL